MKLQSEELQIHAAEITDVRKTIEREKLSKEMIQRLTQPNTKKVNRKARKMHQSNYLPHVPINTSSEELNGYDFTHTTDPMAYPTTESSLIEINNDSGKNDIFNKAKEMMVQQERTISDVRLLHAKIEESLGEHQEMKRKIDELKTEVS